MIIIDTDTNNKLAHSLEKLQANATTMRCIYLDLKDAPERDESLPATVVTLTEQIITDPDTQVFLCEDGDIFILAPAIPSKQANLLLLSIGAVLKRPVNHSWAHFLELPLHARNLMSVVYLKLDIVQRQQEQIVQHAVQQQTARRKQVILNGGIISHENINERRMERRKPAIMVIEDDPFTCRLVENVIRKQYDLTCVGEVSVALDSYARIAPDLLFLDINLPNVTGHELLEKIMIMDPHAYVIMLSGNCDKENIMHSMKMGAKGFVAKPFTRDKLFQYIERCPTIEHA